MFNWMEVRSADEVEDGRRFGGVSRCEWDWDHADRRRTPSFERGAGMCENLVHVYGSINSSTSSSRDGKEEDVVGFDAPSLIVPAGVAQDHEDFAIAHDQVQLLDALVVRALDGRFAELPSATPDIADAHTTATSVSNSGSESMRSSSSTSTFGSYYSSPSPELEMDAPRCVNKLAQKWQLAEQERIESSPKQQKRELRNLANCVHDVSPTRARSLFRRNKLQCISNKVCRFLKNTSARVFFFLKTSEKEYFERCRYRYPAARDGVSAVVMPVNRRSAFIPAGEAECVELYLMRSAPRIATFQIQFTTVQATRDVKAWTMEEYLTRNARLHELENRRNGDEEYGGIEGSNLMMNQSYIDDDVSLTYDSDSD